jgi:predicted GTPase
MDRIRTLILGAAGRDFHNFNVVYRDDIRYEVIGFTATQIPNIAGRRYPADLAGPLYPQGVPIFPEEDLASLIERLDVRQAVFSYSDVAYTYVMHRSAVANAAGADFVLLGPRATMLESAKPVVSVCAVRTALERARPAGASSSCYDAPASVSQWFGIRCHTAISPRSGCSGSRPSPI